MTLFVIAERRDRHASGTGQQHDPYQAGRDQAYGGPAPAGAGPHQDEIHVGYGSLAFHCRAWR